MPPAAGYDATPDDDYIDIPGTNHRDSADSPSSANTVASSTGTSGTSGRSTGTGSTGGGAASARPFWKGVAASPLQRLSASGYPGNRLAFSQRANRSDV